MQMKVRASITLVVSMLSMVLWNPNRSPKKTISTDQDAQTNSLSLSLSTDKQTYKPGEPIYFTLTLRNISSGGLWVGKLIAFADIPGAFVMTVTDEQDKPVHGSMTFFAGSLGDFKHADLFDSIQKTRLLLCAKCFLGMTATLQEYQYSLGAPGKYRLQVSYSDIGYKEMQEMGATSQNIKKAKERAQFPLWFGSITSQEVWIAIEP
jgi:hypothetical protein